MSKATDCLCICVARELFETCRIALFDASKICRSALCEGVGWRTRGLRQPRSVPQAGLVCSAMRSALKPFSTALPILGVLQGDLVCCETCPAVMHADCARLPAIPGTDWHCPLCACAACGHAGFAQRLDLQGAPNQVCKPSLLGNGVGLTSAPYHQHCLVPGLPECPQPGWLFSCKTWGRLRVGCAAPWLDPQCARTKVCCSCVQGAGWG